MAKNLKQFGKLLKKLRITRGLSLREICRKVEYDASNWSKIERGIIAPPSDEKILERWAKAFDLKKDGGKYQQFIDEAQISRGIIPEDILSRKDAVKYLPAVFRTLRNEKPTKEETDRLIELIRNS